MRGEMRFIICGSRDFHDFEMAKKVLDDFLCRTTFSPLTCVLSGTAQGADSLGELWAKQNNIPVERYPANWNKYGKIAGFLRNSEMVKKADAIIAFWDGTSRGTKDTIEKALAAGLHVFVIHFDRE